LNIAHDAQTFNPRNNLSNQVLSIERILKKLILVQEQVQAHLIHILHNVYRVPGFLSSRPNWVHPSLTHKRVLPPPLVPMGGHNCLRDRGGGGGGGGEQIQTKGQSTTYYILYVPPDPLRLHHSR
jgi:hypothetical protein